MATVTKKQKIEEMEMFLEDVRRYRFLYDKTERDFKNITMKRDIWKSIGNRFKISGDEAEKRWRSQRDRYRRDKKKIEDAIKSGAGSSDVPKPTWELFWILDGFLKHCPMESQSTVSNMSQASNMSRASSFYETTASQSLLPPATVYELTQGTIHDEEGHNTFDEVFAYEQNPEYDSDSTDFNGESRVARVLEVSIMEDEAALPSTVSECAAAPSLPAAGSRKRTMHTPKLNGNVGNISNSLKGTPPSSKKKKSTPDIAHIQEVIQGFSATNEAIKSYFNNNKPADNNHKDNDRISAYCKYLEVRLRALNKVDLLHVTKKFEDILQDIEMSEEYL